MQWESLLLLKRNVCTQVAHVAKAQMLHVTGFLATLVNPLQHMGQRLLVGFMFVIFEYCSKVIVEVKELMMIFQILRAIFKTVLVFFPN